MFCPECGTQNPDSAKFCISCGNQTIHPGGAVGGHRPHQVAGSMPGRSGPNYGLIIGGGLAFIVIVGLVSFIVFRGSAGSNQDGSPTPRAKNIPNTSNASASDAPAATNTSNGSLPVSNSSVAGTNSATPVPPVNPTPPPTVKATKKPIDCDKKCYQVYDQCMADYRQHPDPETICRGRQTTCLSKCS